MAGAPPRPRPGGAVLRRIAFAAALLACALGAGGIAAALIPGPARIPDNHIGAGHLAIVVDRGADATLSFDDLMPGRTRRGDQIVTADLTGVGTAALSLTLSGHLRGSRDRDLAGHLALTIRYSDPEPASGIGWAHGTCTPTGGYPHTVRYQNLAALTGARAAALGTLRPGDDGICVRFELALDPAAGDDVQRASADVSWTYDLQQTSAGPG